MYRILPPVLYTLTAFNTYMTVQLPQGALLHWTASSAFTLSLQSAMQHPTVRRWAGLPAPPAPAGSPPSPTPVGAPAAAEQLLQQDTAGMGRPSQILMQHVRYLGAVG